MRLLVLSDSHGNDRALRRALDAHADTRTVVFLGDGLRDIERVADDYPDRVFYTVPGNCDLGSQALPVRQETFGGARTLFTHGHIHLVKHGTASLEQAARSLGVSLVLFGHTHTPLAEYRDGLYLVNPGSVGRDGRYAVVDVENSGIMANLLRL